jgi:ankyrin repeat protein
VAEHQQEVKALFFERVKGSLFKPESEDQLRTKYIIQSISQADIEITYEEKAKEEKKKSRTRKRQEPEEAPKIVQAEINKKAFKSMVAAAKKFRPEESVDEEEGSDNDSEEDQKSARSKSKTQLDESKSIKRIKGPKTQKSETPLVEHKKSKLPPDSDDESQASNLRQAKGKDGKAKGVKLPTVYKKGKWNPNVVLVTKCEQLESKSEVPNFECSARNSNREVIRAAKIGSKRLLDKILESDSKISRLTERWGIENSMTAFKVYIDQGDMEGLIYLLEQLNPAMNKGKTVKYGKDNVVYIKAIDTGFNDKYAYGVATRKVNVSRGGRQGNNAFVEDHKYANIFDDEHITYLVCHQKTTAKDVEKFLGFFPNYEHQLVSKIGDALRAGNTEVAAFLIDRGLKNDGYGLSEFFKLALTAKNEGPLKDIKRPSCTKKAFGVANITPIHCACLNPNSEVLKHILSVNPEYQSLDIQMRKPVHYAACCRSPEPLKFLVSQNVDTREHDNMRTTPLMYAARAGQVENVKFLLQENRSIVMAKDKHGYSAIHYAAEYGHPEIIKLILDAGVKIAMGGPDRKAALHIAAAKGDLETVKFLVDQGAKVTAKDKFKRTPLLLACRNGNLAIASYLLQQGSPFDEADSSGNSPLHYACAYGYPEIIGALLQAGANPNAVNSWNLSPTAVALLKSYFSCLRRMLDDPATNVNCIDDEGRTLVSNAIKTIDAQNFNHVAFLLRDKKADPNIPDAKGLTAFDYLCAHNVDSLAQAEVKSDMSLDQINALKAEKRSLYRKYFTLFLESQADINHKDVNGLTPIFRSLQSSNVDGLELLLQQRSLDLDVVSNTNNSVYHYVEYVVLQDGFFKLMKQLISKAPKHELMNLYNDGGKTPLHMIFGKFMGKLPDLKSQILAELTKELKLKKKQDRKTKGNTKLSQTMDAEGDDEYDDDDDECSDDDDDFGFKEKRMSMKKMKAATKYHGLKGGARMMHRGGFGMKIRATTEDSQLGHNLESVALTTEETQNLEKEAENLFKDRLEEFFEFLRYFQNSGARVTDLIKDPKKPKSTPEGEEGEIDEEDMDYSVEDYFERIYRMLENSVQSKINLPDKKKPSNEVGYSLLHLACSSNNQAVIDFIIKDYKIPVNQRSVYGESELLKFISSNSPSDQSVAVLESLIKKNCDVELANIHAQTPILLAMVLSKDKFILPLIRYKANVNAQDVKGNYPLLQAIKHKSLQMVEILLANNASPNLTDKQRRNSIHWAINLSNADADASNEIENCLLSSGGDLNAVDSRGRCPLHYAFVKIGDPFNKSNIDPIETVSNIISRPGVKVDVRDRWGNTALSYAAQRGAVISALYLLKNMADIDNVNEDGNTPLNICLLNGHQNMSIFLIQKNCKLKVDVKIKKEDERPDDMQESDDELKVNKADQDFESNPYMQKSMMRRPKKAMKKRRKDEEKEEIEYESSESILDEKEDEEEQEDISNMAGNPFGGGSFGMSKGFGYGGGFAKRAVHLAPTKPAKCK